MEGKGFKKTFRLLYEILESLGIYFSHGIRSALISRRIAEHMGFDEKEVKEIELAALFHEIGKAEAFGHRTIFEVVNKKKRFSLEEKEFVKLHSVCGAKTILSFSRKPPWNKVAYLILFHHERPDGGGYPYGLKGNQIPVGSSIIRVAESFDAMTHNRPYRKRLSRKKAIELIEKGAGKKYDTLVVKAFLECLKKDLIRGGFK